MKKYLGILLIICMVFCLTACGKADKEQEQQPTEEIATEESVASTELMSSTEKVSVSEIEKPNTQSAYFLDWDAEDAYLLAKIAMAEAEGEDTEGKALVIRVVLNRVWSDSFPDTIHDVIFQPKQFSPVSNERWDRVEPDEDCYEALKLIKMTGWDESQGALYFESKSDSTWHQEHLKYLFSHGKHYFYTE